MKPSPLCRYEGAGEGNFHHGDDLALLFKVPGKELTTEEVKKVQFDAKEITKNT